MGGGQPPHGDVAAEQGSIRRRRRRHGASMASGRPPFRYDRPAAAAYGRVRLWTAPARADAVIAGRDWIAPPGRAVGHAVHSRLPLFRRVCAVLRRAVGGTEVAEACSIAPAAAEPSLPMSCAHVGVTAPTDTTERRRLGDGRVLVSARSPLSPEQTARTRPTKKRREKVSSRVLNAGKSGSFGGFAAIFTLNKLHPRRSLTFKIRSDHFPFVFNGGSLNDLRDAPSAPAIAVVGRFWLSGWFVTPFDVRYVAEVTPTADRSRRGTPTVLGDRHRAGYVRELVPLGIARATGRVGGGARILGVGRAGGSASHALDACWCKTRSGAYVEQLVDRDGALVGKPVATGACSSSTAARRSWTSSAVGSADLRVFLL